MKVFMIWDYESVGFVSRKYFTPYLFSTFESAEKFLMNYNRDLVLTHKNDMHHSYVFKGENSSEDFSYKISEVEIDAKIE